MTITTPATASTGTFTPGIAFGGGSTGITYLEQQGYYTQIGNVVNFTLAVYLSSKGSSTGVASITGLPIAAGPNGDVNCIPCICSRVTFTTGYTNAFVELVNSSTNATISQNGSAQNDAALMDTNFANNSFVLCSGTYLVNV